MKGITTLAFLVIASVSTTVLAADTAPSVASGMRIAPGMQTHAWLQAQAQGTMASTNPQAAKAIQRDKAAERFMKTYDFPIKESFYGDTFKSGQ